MASFLENDLYLIDVSSQVGNQFNSQQGVPISSQPSLPNSTLFSTQFNTQPGIQVAFSGTNMSESLLVGFHQISRNEISPTPSSSVCPGSQYAIRVVLPNDSNIYILAPGSSNQFTLINGIPSDISSVVIFEPLDLPMQITSSTAFSGNLIINGQVSSNQFIIIPRDDFAQAGYSEKLPVLLNNCASCGCQNDFECGSNGQCTGIADICTENALCGDNDGVCPGKCFGPNNRVTKCRRIEGKYECVPHRTRSAWTIVVLILLGIAFFSIVFYFVWMILRRGRNPNIELYPYEHDGPCRPMMVKGTDGCYKTVYGQPVKRKVVPVDVEHYTLKPIQTVAEYNTPDGKRQYMVDRNTQVYEACPLGESSCPRGVQPEVPQVQVPQVQVPQVQVPQVQVPQVQVPQVQVPQVQVPQVQVSTANVPVNRPTQVDGKRFTTISSDLPSTRHPSMGPTQPAKTAKNRPQNPNPQRLSTQLPTLDRPSTKQGSTLDSQTPRTQDSNQSSMNKPKKGVKFSPVNQVKLFTSD